jgi:hypothetical protein
LRHEKPERYKNTKKFEYRKSPIHIVSTSDPKAKSVELCPRRLPGETTVITKPLAVHKPRGRGTMSSKVELHYEEPPVKPLPIVPSDLLSHGDLYNMNSISQVLDNGDMAVPHVLISLALEEQLLDFEQCRRWLQDFPGLAQFAKVQGVYRSNSTLLLLSIPVVVWNWIPDDPACFFIGYVHSCNLNNAKHDETNEEVVHTQENLVEQINQEEEARFPSRPGLHVAQADFQTPQEKNDGQVSYAGTSRSLIRRYVGRFLILAMSLTYGSLLILFVFFTKETTDIYQFQVFLFAWLLAGCIIVLAKKCYYNDWPWHDDFIQGRLVHENVSNPSDAEFRPPAAVEEYFYGATPIPLMGSESQITLVSGDDDLDPFDATKTCSNKNQPQVRVSKSYQCSILTLTLVLMFAFSMVRKCSCMS